jgi:hypothetical protein
MRLALCVLLLLLFSEPAQRAYTSHVLISKLEYCNCNSGFNRYELTRAMCVKYCELQTVQRQ